MSADERFFVPPHNLEAEMAVLGSILVDRSMLDEVADTLRPDDFHSPRHGRLYAVMLDLAKASEPVDRVSVTEHLRSPSDDRAAEFAFLGTLTDIVSSAASVSHYAKVVREKSDLRALIKAGNAIARLGYEGEDDAQRAGSDADLILREALDRSHKTKGALDLMEALKANYYRVCDVKYGEQMSLVQKTPWPGFNAFVGGFSPGNLVVWGAREKVGKSGAVLTLADYVAAHYGSVMYCSLELTLEEMIQRYVALYSGVSVKRQLEGSLTDSDIALVADAMGVIAERQVHFYGRQQCPSIADIRAEMRELRRSHHVVTLIIDGLNFLKDRDAQSRYDRTTTHERLDAAYRELLRVASDYEVVVHAVTHVNRQGAQKGHPEATDIRDGGNPEGHAHAVIIPFRPHPTSENAAEREEGEFVIAAIRTGSAGAVPMRFKGGRGLWLDANAMRPWFEMPPPGHEQPELSEFIV